MSLGTVVVDGRSYRISGLELRRGLLFITAHGHPGVHAPASPDTPATVFGSDGQGICQGWKTPMPELDPELHVTIVLPIRIGSLEDVDEDV